MLLIDDIGIIHQWKVGRPPRVTQPAFLIWGANDADVIDIDVQIVNKTETKLGRICSHRRNNNNSKQSSLIVVEQMVDMDVIGVSLNSNLAIICHPR